LANFVQIYTAVLSEQ